MEPSAQIDAREFSRLLVEVKEFDKQLGLRLRKNIRDAAKPIVEDVKKTVLDGPGKRDVGVRKAIAAGVRVRIGTNVKRGGSVTIAATGGALPANRKSMLRSYNKEKGWRHPVFPRKHLGGLLTSTKWVQQMGRPYFGSVILAHKEDLAKAVEKALDEAAAALASSN